MIQLLCYIVTYFFVVYFFDQNERINLMAKTKIDEEKLIALVKANTPVADIASQLGIDSIAYAKSKVKDALVKISTPDYPGLYVGRGSSGASGSKIQPKLTKKGAINLNKRLFDSWEVKPPEGTIVIMKVSRDKTKITLALGEASDE